MPMSESMYVVVLSYNGLADTRKCLSSLYPALRPWVRPVLVDNGSTDGTAEAVRCDFPWCEVLRVEVNHGPVGGNNAGLRAALASGEKWIMLLNNDTTVDERLFETMAAAAAANPQFDVLGPVIYYMDDPDVVMTDGCVFNLPRERGIFIRKEVPLTRQDPPRVTEVDIVNGCCLMIRADMIRRTGLFDDRIFMYHDEADLCLRVKARGGRLGIIDHGLVWHKGSATARVTGTKSIRYFDARNLWYILRKPEVARANGRGPLGTAAAYWRCMYYWFEAERQNGSPGSAQAVVDGVTDGLTGVSGPYEPARRRMFAPVVRWVLSAMIRFGSLRAHLRTAAGRSL
jgi:GT2 family glycosyltransferase